MPPFDGFLKRMVGLVMIETFYFVLCSKERRQEMECCVSSCLYLVSSI